MDNSSQLEAKIRIIPPAESGAGEGAEAVLLGPLPPATSAPLPGHADRHPVVLAPRRHRLLVILSRLLGILSRLSVILFLIFFLQLDEAFCHRSGGQHRLR